MERPSRGTSSESDSVPVAARGVTLTSLAAVWDTLTPGTWRRKSAIVSPDASRMVASVTTLIVAGAFLSFSSRRDAVTTTTSAGVCAGGAAGSACAGGSWRSGVPIIPATSSASTRSIPSIIDVFLPIRFASIRSNATLSRAASRRAQTFRDDPLAASCSLPVTSVLRRTRAKR